MFERQKDSRFSSGTLVSGTLIPIAVGILLTFTVSRRTEAQTSSAPPPVTFTAEQDHQNMMDQLGIKALRPGPSGDEKAPNHANYDESLANPYPESARSPHAKKWRRK